MHQYIFHNTILKWMGIQLTLVDCYDPHDFDFLLFWTPTTVPVQMNAFPDGDAAQQLELPVQAPLLVCSCRYPLFMILGMGWVHIFRFVMIQRILMTTIICILLNLLCMMAVYGWLLQISNNVLQVFIDACLGFAHSNHSFSWGYVLVLDCNDWAHS